MYSTMHNYSTVLTSCFNIFAQMKLMNSQRARTKSYRRQGKAINLRLLVIITPPGFIIIIVISYCLYMCIVRTVIILRIWNHGIYNQRNNYEGLLFISIVIEKSKYVGQREIRND